MVVRNIVFYDRIFVMEVKEIEIVLIILPKMAITTSSFNISMDPLAIKYKHVSTSPL